MLAVDEAYGQFAPSSALELLETEPRLVVVRTFSKTWAMAGLRLGYAIADPSVVASLSNVALPYHLDTLKQVAGRLALRFSDEMKLRVAPPSRSEDASPRPFQACRSKCGPPMRTSSCFASSPRPPRRSGRACSIAPSWFAMSRTGPGCKGAFASPSARVRRTTGSSPRWLKCSRHRAPTVERPGRPPDRASAILLLDQRPRSAETALDVVQRPRVVRFAEQLASSAPPRSAHRRGRLPMRKNAQRSETRAACCMLCVTMTIVTRLLSSLEELFDEPHRDRVQRRGRLVHQEHLRLHGQCSGDAQALLLTPGKRRCVRLHPVRDRVPQSRGDRVRTRQLLQERTSCVSR